MALHHHTAIGRGSRSGCEGEGEVARAERLSEQLWTVDDDTDSDGIEGCRSRPIGGAKGKFKAAASPRVRSAACWRQTDTLTQSLLTASPTSTACRLSTPLCHSLQRAASTRQARPWMTLCDTT